MHTPLSFINSNVSMNVFVGDVADANGRTVIKGIDARKAHAIIQAVNAHEAMKAALEEARDYIARMEGDWNRDNVSAYQAVIAAIALAEGKG